MRRAAILTLTLLFCLALVAPLTVEEASAGTHQDDRLGFKVSWPNKWTKIPIKPGEEWIAAKFFSEKKYRWTDPDGWLTEHQPTMKVINFITAEVKKKDGGSIEVGGMTINFGANPYKNYEDYMDRTYSGGGWHISKKEEKKINGVPTTCIEIKVEKLTRNGPRRIVTWIFHTPEVDFAVEFEVLEDAYPKLRGTIYSCLKTFKLVPRTEGSLSTATTGEKTKFTDESKLTPTERMERRKTQEKKLHAAATKDLPRGWQKRKIGRFLVLDHVGDNFKYAKKVVTNAEAVWRWLDKTFDYIGPDEYVPTPVLRVCANSTEESHYRSGTSWVQDLEITTHKNVDVDFKDWEYAYVNEKVMRIWFRHRDRDLYYAMPSWLDMGLQKVLGRARPKGARIEFEFDLWDKQAMREAVKRRRILAPQDIMKLTGDELDKKLQAMGQQGTQGLPAGFANILGRSNQYATLVRFFVAGAASRNRKTKTLLKDYLTNLSIVAAEIEKENAAKEPEAEKAPETEEEEAERAKKQQEAWGSHEKPVLERTFERTFGDWSEADWRKFEAVYYASLG